jgi:methyltransferase (TIGR00027 family)
MEGVGATSLVTAAARALETDRPEGLLSDPFARELAGDEGFELLALGATGLKAANGTPLYVVRHRFFDDFLIEVTATAALRQVVLVAAGLDMRAFRLDWPSDTQVFEIDQPAVFAHKNSVIEAHGLAPRCTRVVVEADLRENWPHALTSAGFDLHCPTVWLAEGLLFYLPEPAVHSLIQAAFRLSAPGSWLAADLMSSSSGPPQQLRDLFASLGAPFIFSTDQPAVLFSGHGWQPEVISFPEVARRLGTELASGGRVVIAYR